MSKTPLKLSEVGGEAWSSRREFLQHSLTVAACAALGPTARLTASQPEKPTARKKPRVVQITDPKMIPVRVVQKSLLKDHFKLGLLAFTNTATVAEAWRTILKPDDVILLKFNRSASDRLGTSPAMIGEIVSSLVDSGWSPEQIMALEAPRALPRSMAKLKRADLRWQGEVVKFGQSGQDSFIAALDQATAVINVPFLKTHHRATMTACLKNLSHGLIRHPARFHGGGCDPAIGEIAASSPISSKLRLNIVNGLRVVFDRGPEARDRDIASAGTLLFGSDPVACDSVGYGILNGIRALHKIPPLLPDSRVPRQLSTASRMGAGEYDPERIELQQVPR